MKNLLKFINIDKRIHILSQVTKRRVLLLFFLCSVLILQANTYNFLVFTSTSGIKTSFNVDNLVLTVTGNELQVGNDDGTVNLTLLELASMYFSNDNSATSLENVLNANSPVEVLSVLGASLGTYTSLVEATQHLNSGTYVISNGSVTQTIVVNK